MVGLAEDEYVREITDFVNTCGDGWTLHKINDSIISKQSVICRYEEQVLNRQCHFIYNRKLSRLELWFMMYCRSGRPLRIREIAAILGTKPESNDAIVVELAQHPTLAIPFYKLYENPTDSSDLMSKVQNEKNYVARWIRAFGAEAGLSNPSKEQNSDVLDSSSSCSQSITSTDEV
ncbi:unnamed protein product [Caenorhabditis bovis]|uniref:Uncharacterized protein n=1 Tax=Caenorhabditis bovis TaxID=2654633 RepID=A0A8S1FEM3_9PELO|nr:unnamed protein product [Caenorhabditis bovis]